MNAWIPLAIALVLAGCGQRARLPQEAENAARLAAAAPEAPRPSPGRITDGRVRQYIVYAREMAPFQNLLLEVGMEALNHPGVDQKAWEAKMAADPRTKKIEAAQANAQAKSGLSLAESNDIGRVCSDYTPGATMGDDAMKKESREKFLAKYGPEALAVMERNLKDLAQLQDDLLKAAFTKKK